MTDTLWLAAIEWRHLLGTTPLEIIATVCAVAGVFLIARQNILGWPLGMVWAGISAYLAFFQWSLVSDGILYAAYIPIQLYCWVVWARSGGATAETPFVPTWLPRRRQLVIAGAAALSIAAWALSISWLAGRIPWIPEPALLWRDSATTVLNFYAQFLQARKRMENWVGWLIVNVLGIHIYWVKDSPIYSVQYAFFLALGLYGWWKWHRSRTAAAA
jgi:nicotinamide mononucleotide transporter